MSSPAPYGSWASPISPSVVARSGVSFDAVQMAGDAVYWIEGRPDRRQDMLVRWRAETGPEDLLPRDVGVGSRVHEYGGGAYLATEAGVWFCHEDDQRLYALSAGDPSAVAPASARYADARLTPDRRTLICVRERDDVNELISVPAHGGEAPHVIASGWDFYAFPRVSPDGRWLAWTTWRQPLMPWDGTWLWIAALLPDGGAGPPQHIAGGPSESVLQPEWSPDGELHFVSDRSGWWNLYAWRDGRIEPVLLVEGELGVAQWELGYATYAFLRHGRIAVLLQEGARQRLAILHRASGDLEPVSLPYTSIKPYLASEGTRVALIGSSPTTAPVVALVDLSDRRVDELARAPAALDLRYVGMPEAFSYRTRDGEQSHGLFHPPTNPDRVGSRGERPPLIVRPHAGPTHNTPLRLDPHVQFFTSRGFAVADVDYRGSTGYGRAYRQALRGQWGKRDVADCVDVADHLAGTTLAA